MLRPAQLIHLDLQKAGDSLKTANRDDALPQRMVATSIQGGSEQEPKRSPHHQWEVGMTRTDVMASSRPQAIDVAPMRRGATGDGNQEPNKPSTGPSPSKETGTGTSPSKEAGTPTTSTSKETAPSTSSATPTSQKASTLPFTGFDLRWSVGAGLLLMGAGFSIVAAQRRQRRESGR